MTTRKVGGRLGDVGASKKKRKEDDVALGNFGRNLVELALQKKLDPVVGRDKEIEQIIEIISKRKKNNPLLIGESGVGKTALVEGLAIRIAEKKVDPSMYDLQLIEISFSNVLAGTKYRGDFEARVKSIIDEATSNKNIIVFIDEIHTIVGAGGSGGGLDASNMIKPALARGDFRCIGATTIDDAKKSIENDKALDRRFQKVKVFAPNKEMTLEILKKIKTEYEKFHNVTYHDDILKEIVDKSDRFINYKNFPDKAIDILDEAGALAKSRFPKPKKIEEVMQQLELITKEKRSSAANGLYEEAAKLRDKQIAKQQELDKEITSWSKQKNEQKINITTNDINSIINRHTGIPMQKIGRNIYDEVKTLDTYLKSKVIGQDAAIEKVVQAVKRNKVGIKEEGKPFVMMFLGSTGTGKTLLAKAMAEHLFEDKGSFVRLDMSEYIDGSSVTKLVGSAPGYVGYTEKGFLTERLKNNPHSLVLVDEIEKAHPNVLNVFLQIFDEGRITDNYGNEIDAKNCMIVLTSNIGTLKASENKMSFFESEKSAKEIEDIVLKELEKSMTPELINRIDEKIVFNPITEDIAKEIINTELKLFSNELLKSGFNIGFDGSLVNWLYEDGYDKKYGARDLKRGIVKNVKNYIADMIIDEKISQNKKYNVKFDTKTKEIVLKNARAKRTRKNIV